MEINCNDEIWKSIDGHPSYEISSYGNVRSLDRYTYKKIDRRYKRNKNKSLPDKMLIKGQAMNPYINKKGHAVLELNRVKKNVTILVANAFVPNPYNYPHIKYKDGIKHSNNASNLEWSPYSYRYKLNEQTRAEAVNCYLNTKDSLDNIAARYGVVRGILKIWVIKSGGKIRAIGDAQREL